MNPDDAYQIKDRLGYVVDTAETGEEAVRKKKELNNRCPLDGPFIIRETDIEVSQ